MNTADQPSPVWQPSARYPDPRVEVLDPRFNALRIGSARVERLATGFRWAEGPVWFGDHRSLLWSDIPNNRIMRWDERNESLSVFRQPSDFANGNTRDREGRLVSCEHGTRRVTRTEIEVIAEQNNGAATPAPERSLTERLGALVDESLQALDMRERVQRLSDSVSNAVEHIVHLIVIFALQSIILPLVFLWLFAEALKKIAARAARL